MLLRVNDFGKENDFHYFVFPYYFEFGFEKYKTEKIKFYQKKIEGIKEEEKRNILKHPC